MAQPYSAEPTSNADIQAEIMRHWYERNRESFWTRWGLGGVGYGTDAGDEFMLRMLAYARLVLSCEIPRPDDYGE